MFFRGLAVPISHQKFQINLRNLYCSNAYGISYIGRISVDRRCGILNIETKPPPGLQTEGI